MTDNATITRELHKGGMRKAFLVPSIHSLGLIEELARSGIECIPARSELGAAHMADGHARVSQELTGLVTSTGPGAGNAIGGFSTAAKDGSAVVHLSTTNYPGQKRRPAVHGLHTVLEQSAWTAGGAPVLDFGAGDWLDELTSLAKARRPFSILVPTLSERGGASAPVTLPTVEVEDDDSTLRAGLDRWSDAPRRLLWIGGGARKIGIARLIELAERSEAAVITTIQGKDLFPSSHPQFLGCTWNAPGARSVGGLADSCLVLGSRLTEISSSVWSAPFPPLIIDVGIGTRDHLFENCETVQIQADVDRAVTALLDGPVTFGSPGDRWGAQAASSAAERREEHPADPMARDLLRAVTEGLETGDVLVADMTKLSFHAIVGLRLPSDVRFLFPGLLNMGFGLPAAIGASHAAPDRHVIAMIGDGSLLSVLPELERASHVPGTTTVVLLDDNAYGLLDFRLEEELADRICRFDGPEWSQLGSAFGIPVHDVPVTGLGGALRARSGGFEILRVDVTGLGNDWRLS